MTPPSLREAASLAGLGPRALGAMARTGVLRPIRPDRLAGMVAAPLRLGAGAATACAATAARWPNQPALVDERGTLTWRELDDRGGALAAGLAEELDVGPGRGLAVMCRNHRGFVEPVLAGSRLGADLLLLNTDFPGPQLAQVLEREQPAAAVFDEEFAGVFDAAGFEGGRVVAWRDGDGPGPTTNTLIRRQADRGGGWPATRAQGRVVILTSGTTGTPKGAPRDPGLTALVGPMTTLLSRIPLRTSEPMLVAPPFFHGFGLAYLGLAMLLGSTVVMRRRFDAEATLAAIDEHGVTTLIAVPVMLKRILELPAEVRERYDTSSLRIVISAAAPLSADLAAALTDEFGEVVHDLYGTTEAGFAAIATPEDLREAPGTVGRPPIGTTLRILGADDTEVPAGETGRIFVGSGMLFEGYSGGGSKEMVGGLMSTGDLGHMDRSGRLHIDGREDDMIVSGGENVFPGEVEDVLSRHSEVDDVAVLGVPDEEFGQRLQAFVVLTPGGVVTEADLKAHVKASLARYKVPREIAFIDAIPRNPTGKVLRRKLRA